MRPGGGAAEASKGMDDPPSPFALAPGTAAADRTGTVSLGLPHATLVRSPSTIAAAFSSWRSNGRVGRRRRGAAIEHGLPSPRPPRGSPRPSRGRRWGRRPSLPGRRSSGGGGRRYGGALPFDAESTRRGTPTTPRRLAGGGGAQAGCPSCIGAAGARRAAPARRPGRRRGATAPPVPPDGPPGRRVPPSRAEIWRIRGRRSRHPPPATAPGPSSSGRAPPLPLASPGRWRLGRSASQSGVSPAVPCRRVGRRSALRAEG